MLSVLSQDISALVLYSVSQKMVHVEMRHFDQHISLFSTAFYMIFKNTKLALKYRLFRHFFFFFETRCRHNGEVQFNPWVLVSRNTEPQRFSVLTPKELCVESLRPVMPAVILEVSHHLMHY